MRDLSLVGLIFLRRETKRRLNLSTEGEGSENEVSKIIKKFAGDLRFKVTLDESEEDSSARSRLELAAVPTCLQRSRRYDSSRTSVHNTLNSVLWRW